MGEDRMVIYTTSLRGVRRTFEACNAVRSAVESFGVVVCERDVSMDRGFRDELVSLMGKRVKDDGEEALSESKKMEMEIESKKDELWKKVEEAKKTLAVLNEKILEPTKVSFPFSFSSAFSFSFSSAFSFSSSWGKPDDAGGWSSWGKQDGGGGSSWGKQDDDGRRWISRRFPFPC